MTGQSCNHTPCPSEGFLKKSLAAAAQLTVAIVLLSLASAMVCAQSTATGTVSGQVTDPTSAVIVGATVTLTDTATGGARTTTTNENGRYLRSEEHTSELQSRFDLVCRLLLEK